MAAATLALLCLLLPWLAASPLAAARWTSLAATVFHNYGRDQGLPHPVPTALAQDRDGFIWIGTQGGLARWDGYRFHGYRADSAVPGSLPDDWIQTLHVDPTGRLWVGGGAGGLARYDAARDGFTRIAIGQPRSRVHIGAIADDGRGGLWVGSDEGLHHLDTATGQVTTRAGLPVRALLRDRTGALWLGTTRGLARRAAGSKRFVPVALVGETVSITELHEDERGRVWIGTQRHGLQLVDRSGANPRRIGETSPLSAGSVSSINQAGPHEIWVGLRGRGVVAVDTVSEQLRLIQHDRTVANSLAHNDVWAMLRDQAGSMWVGSMGGLSYHPSGPAIISTVLAAQEQANGLTASDPFALLPTRDGRLWLGYIDGKVDILDPERGRVATLGPGQLPPDVITSMAEAPDGSVYIGTRRGLYRADREARGARLVPLPGRPPHDPASAVAFADGLLWVGGEESGQLTAVALDQSNRVVFGPREAAGMADDGINTIFRGQGNDLWIGSRNGLYRIDLASRKIEHIAADPASPTGLPGRFVVAMLIDRQGRLWAGTFGGGLAVMTGRGPDGKPRFRRLTMAQGLPHNNVDSLQMDGSGTIWAGTDDGLARVDPTSLAIRALRQADGSALIDYYGGAGATSPTGEALFGAKGGFTIVRPGRLAPWTFQPPLVVTDLRIGGKPVPVALVNQGMPNAPLTIAPGGNSLAVEFAALDFTAPERNRYAYRLEGYDDDWTETDANRRLAIYTNLPPGNYVLRLRGSNRAGVWSERELALPVKVKPAWYQRLWFKAALTLLAMLAVAGIVRWRTRYLRHRQLLLERQIAARTADLRAANERLGQLAITDPLTGCANRRHFMAVAEDLIEASRRDGSPLTLAVLDLDEFKKINDTHGHPAGDAVLSVAGITLLDHIGEEDLVGRIGGEEFAMLLPLTTLAEACERAETIRAAIERRRIPRDSLAIMVTSSIGLAELQPDEALDQLYARADAALYAAKAAGRNRVETMAVTG